MFPLNSLYAHFKPCSEKEPHIHNISLSFFSISNYQFELHVLSFLALDTCLKKPLLKDTLKHWLWSVTVFQNGKHLYLKILSFWILQWYRNNSKTKLFENHADDWLMKCYLLCMICMEKTLFLFYIFIVYLLIYF